MKIALLTLAGHEFKGGVEKFNSMLMDAVGKKHEVELIAYRDLVKKSFVSNVFDKTPYSGYYKAKEMAKKFKTREDEFDLVIANDFFGTYVKKPKIVVFHGYYGDIFDCMHDRITLWYWLWGQELGRVQRLALKNSDVVVTPSQRNFDYLKARKLKVDKMISHGIDTEFYKNDLNAMKKLASFDLPKEFLLSVGTRAPWKNIDAIEAISQDYNSVVISGNEKSGKIKFLSGIDEKLMPAFYSASKLLFHPSLHEGFGYVIGEAMSCGVPAVYSKVGFGTELAKEIPELIVENPRDYLEVKRVIENTLDNRAELSRRSRQYVETHFNLVGWGKKWLDVIGDFE